MGTPTASNCGRRPHPTKCLVVGCMLRFGMEYTVGDMKDTDNVCIRHLLQLCVE